ncbi:MAG: hypothetical protein V7K32_16170 [Nostoc sp.]|uniref:hypothetical protein n=1 Tax=Nostoc sp. TaxID=1180 RepID=UPI002FF8E2F7
MTLSAIVDFEPHINAVSRKVRSSKTDDQTFYVMKADNHPKIISVSLQLRFGTTDQH